MLFTARRQVRMRQRQVQYRCRIRVLLRTAVRWVANRMDCYERPLVRVA